MYIMCSARSGQSRPLWCTFLVYILVLLAFTKDLRCCAAQELKSPSSDFSRYRIVTPTVHHGRTRREIATTRDSDGTHHEAVSVTVSIDSEDYLLDLRLNRDLVSGNHVLRYQDKGQTITHEPKREELDLCQYHGKVRGKEDSWVAVSTCRGVRGVIYDGTQMRYIEPAQDHSITSQHFIYDHSSLQTHHTCGYDGGVINNTEYDPVLLKQKQDDQLLKRISRQKRASPEDIKVRGPYNSNQLSRYVELVLVADHETYVVAGQDIKAVHQQMKDVANIINSIYAPLNIFIALVGVVVWSEKDEIQLDENGHTTLKNFGRYRKTSLLNIPNDNTQLITFQKFNGDVVGDSFLGHICTYEFSCGVSTNHSEVIGLVAATIAHEMGHNFGMRHDTEDDCECPEKHCIMSLSSPSVTPTHWSSCSLRSLALSFEKGMDYCLRNKPTRLVEPPSCGNGFVEPGEQCDCGINAAKECRACCDSHCMLRSNATCATGECCDLSSCRPKSAGSVCRTADKECDLPEYCTGYSEFCPKDVYKMDSTPCGKTNFEAYCVGGWCRSHADQCRLLWGSTGESSHDICYYRNNVKGNRFGNCGYNISHQIFHACALQDSMCGTLLCRSLNENPKLAMGSFTLSSGAIMKFKNGTVIQCRMAIIDLGLNDVDPGLVPDGAKCGDNRMCLNQKCVSVESVRADIASRQNSVCPSDCNGHGVCNSEGHCHCEPGFASPLCELPGPGGSYDSGPATDPTRTHRVQSRKKSSLPRRLSRGARDLLRSQLSEQLSKQSAHHRRTHAIKS